MKLTKNEKNIIAGHKRRAEFKLNPLPKSLNPKTGERYVSGDYENGKWFVAYIYERDIRGEYCRENWTSDFEVHQRYQIGRRIRKSRQTALKNNIPFNIDTDYLLSILPDPLICPALGIKMEWCSKDRNVLPSVDKIIPEKGYVKGNVVWVSMKANRYKTNASLDELNNLVTFYNQMDSEKWKTKSLSL